MTYLGFTEEEVKNMILTAPISVLGIKYNYRKNEQLGKSFSIFEKLGERATSYLYDPCIKDNIHSSKQLIFDSKFAINIHQGIVLNVPIAPAETEKLILPSEDRNIEQEVLKKSHSVKITFNITTSTNLILMTVL